MQKFNFSYDKENDDLFLYSPKSNSKGSVEMGDIVFDYNSKKELVGLQIMNASKTIKNTINETNLNIKEVLADLKGCKVSIKSKNNWLTIKIYLFGKIREIDPVISIPNIHETSPALAYQ